MDSTNIRAVVVYMGR